MKYHEIEVSYVHRPIQYSLSIIILGFIIEKKNTFVFGNVLNKVPILFMQLLCA